MISGDLLQMDEEWQEYLEFELSLPSFKNLIQFVNAERAKEIVYPPHDLIFEAFRLCKPDKVKVVIIGQDPYHGPGEAHGLAFSVPPGTKIPPSLQNIFKELTNDIEGFAMPKHGNLSQWAMQGVLLINSVLTVRANNPRSHKGKGWETFTDKCISILSKNNDHLVFLLWGNDARKKKNLININKHLVLEAAHPSPLSAYNGFFGCKHFSKANYWLANKGFKTIDWQIKERL